MAEPKVSPIQSPPAAHNGAPTPQHPPQNIMMIQPTPLNGLGALPAVIDCPYCHRRTQTRVHEEDSSMTIVAGIALGCLCICLACLPCILHWCQNIDHYCTGCNQRVVHIQHGGVPQVIAPPQNVPQQYKMENPQQYGDHQSPQPQQQHASGGMQSPSIQQYGIEQAPQNQYFGEAQSPGPYQLGGLQPQPSQLHFEAPSPGANGQPHNQGLPGYAK
ncbi:uncharacterized protein BCR38DRAFT_481896 [Pseudomassariella vexata]|uniref:LITAF domain-containing protein n=1 Tax=Pseudomassariella vexata TaxID=1141098 RepID=A0A1Y2EC35_9PEZI|nr:uncharacterized protein BCR38DRAFT_481896 [Pseudomassariella vexata]ORY68405.1 hypothetical protein BCR38DRAFT_481896 [Pseudomassariella vexata]